MEPRMRGKLILIGFMGTGKSSVSRELADRLGWDRVDIDEEIERLDGRSISDIFAVDGEESFREMESNVLRTIVESAEAAVVATGGGAVLKPVNRLLMSERGFVVALKASPETIIARVQQDLSRPLLQGDIHDRVHTLLKKREGAYDFAHLSLDTTNLSLGEVVDAILREWNRYALALSNKRDIEGDQLRWT